MALNKPILLNEKTIIDWMERLIVRAKLSGEEGEVPVAAVVIDSNGLCIGHGKNKRNKFKDPFGHAELIAIRQAAWIKNDWRLNDCTLMVTLEPCTMCAAALIQARVGQVIFATEDLKRGGLGGALNLAEHYSAHHQMIVKGGFLANKSQRMLQEWFKKRRTVSGQF